MMICVGIPTFISQKKYDGNVTENCHIDAVTGNGNGLLWCCEIDRQMDKVKLNGAAIEGEDRLDIDRRDSRTFYYILRFPMLLPPSASSTSIVFEPMNRFLSQISKTSITNVSNHLEPV